MYLNSYCKQSSIQYNTIKVTLKAPKKNMAEFANSVDPVEVAHNELPHLDLHCSLAIP